MSTDNEVRDVPLSVLSDAGAWLVRLSGPLKTPATAEGFQKWLREDPLHGVAFRQVSEEWDEADRLKRFTDVVIRVPGHREDPARPGRPVLFSRPLLAWAAGLTLLLVGGMFHYSRTPGFETAVNELRVVTLEDGSRVHLNTSTRIAVSYDEERRQIRLDSGEALFEVARKPGRPFIVTVGDRSVTALGTSFLVRRQRDGLSVTLLDGKVAVSPPREDAAKAVVLTPGERFTLAGHARPKLDRPHVGKLLAWQQGKVAIDSMPLAQAVAEMNRYSSIPLVLQQAQPDALLVSGVFTAGQSMSFARAMAQSYGLRVIDRGDSIELSGSGRSMVSGSR